jgi:hypothetical protein
VDCAATDRTGRSGCSGGNRVERDPNSTATGRCRKHIGEVTAASSGVSISRSPAA